LYRSTVVSAAAGFFQTSPLVPKYEISDCGTVIEIELRQFRIKALITLTLLLPAHFILSYPGQSGEVQPCLRAKAKLTELQAIKYCTRAEQVIEISERVEVPAAPRIVWDMLSDPRAVVDCMPGAKLGDRLEDGSYDATVTVKFGPAKVTFRAKVALELDGIAMTGHVSSRGRDDQGGTRVKTAMTFKVVAGQAPGSSAVPIDAQVEISGRLASLVESGAALVVKRMTGEFTERLAARCAKATA
jgi:uncharacterized protein